jgi:hypothetical protein
MAKAINETLENLKFPLSKTAGKKEEPPAKKLGNTASPLGGDKSEKFKDAMAIPVPGKDDFWYIEDITEAAKSKGVFSKLLKKKELSVDIINDLKKEAVQAPGNTRTKIKRLKKIHPYNSELYMLSAICTNGMLMNSSNRDEVLRGLKYAVKEAAIGLLGNGISLYNCESFYKIYFVMLDRLKRHQSKTLGMLSDDPKYASSRLQLNSVMKATEFLYNEKSKVINVINHLKKKLKSSNYIALFNPMDIKEAAHQIEKGNPKEQGKFGTAAELISYVYALSLTFGRTPLLNRLVDKILRLLPDKESSLLARKISINSIRRFGAFRMASADADRDEMQKIAHAIIKENALGLSRFSGQAIYHSYEADLFFNTAYVAELSHSLFQGKEYTEIADLAIKAMETLTEKDMSKGNLFSDNANSHLRRLTQFKDDKLAEMDTGGK